MRRSVVPVRISKPEFRCVDDVHGNLQYERGWPSQSTLELGLSRNYHLMQLYECR